MLAKIIIEAIIFPFKFGVRSLLRKSMANNGIIIIYKKSRQQMPAKFTQKSAD
jgi:hypothetical protein